LRPAFGRARPVPPQPHQLLRQRLDTKTLRQRRDQHHAGIADDPLVVESDLHPIRSDRLVILHHKGDLLPQARLLHQP